MEFLTPHHPTLTTPPSHRHTTTTTGHHHHHPLVVDRCHPNPLDEQNAHFCSRFPTSSDRLGWPASFPAERQLTATTTTTTTAPSSTRYDPLGSLAQDEHIATRKALCSSFSPRFFPSSIARGVLSDGTWTTEHPSVHAFLQQCPFSPPALTSRTSAAIYSLAALHVFYRPSHPSYDAFWHPTIKESTAVFVHQVITMKPSPISTAPMTWLGVHDMLWQLTGIQKEYFKSQGGKPTTPPLVPTRRSLRKRKPVQALIQELSTREPSEVPDAPPRKKTKITKSDENAKGSDTTPSVTLDQPDISTEDKAGPSGPPRTKSIVQSPPEMRGNADATPSPLTITSSLPPESNPPQTKDDVSQAGTSRKRSRDASSKKKASAAAQAKSAATPSQSSSARRTRERSPSFSSGSSTAVSATGGTSKRARSSSSASSTITTVDADSGGGGGGGGGGGSGNKGKGKKKADAGDETDEDDEDEDHDNEVRKRPTRARRSTVSSSTAARESAVPKSSSRKQGGGSGGTTSSRITAEIDKVAAAGEAPRRVRNRSGVTSSRSRKSRKS